MPRRYQNLGTVAIPNSATTFFPVDSMPLYVICEDDDSPTYKIIVDINSYAAAAQTVGIVFAGVKNGTRVNLRNECPKLPLTKAAAPAALGEFSVSITTGATVTGTGYYAT